jgi:hypothetical protein
MSNVRQLYLWRQTLAVLRPAPGHCGRLQYCDNTHHLKDHTARTMSRPRNAFKMQPGGICSHGLVQPLQAIHPVPLSNGWSRKRAVMMRFLGTHHLLIHHPFTGTKGSKNYPRKFLNPTSCCEVHATGCPSFSGSQGVKNWTSSVLFRHS